MRALSLSDQLLRFTPEPVSGCHLWDGHVKAEGYGVFMTGGQNYYAHRYIWEKANGPVPSGLELHHKCGVKSCVNVAHLELTTRRDHPDCGPALNAAKTHCPKGHPYDNPIENTRVLANADGTYTVTVVRKCRRCRNAYRKAWRERTGKD